MRTPFDYVSSLQGSAKRNAAIVKERKAGLTFAALAKKYGISRARCEQIYKRYK